MNKGRSLFISFIFLLDQVYSCLANEPVDTEGRNYRGLKNIAKIVSIKICEKGTTCYREIADEVVLELANTEKRSLKDERSIRRRVYDALNILLAMKFIKKERRSIQWHGPRLTWNNLEPAKRPNAFTPISKNYREQPFRCSSESCEQEGNIPFVKKPLTIITIPVKNGQLYASSTGDFKTLKLRSIGNIKLFDENILSNAVSNKLQ